MIKVCDNKSCAHHLDVNLPKTASYVVVLEGAESIRVDRFLYRESKGTEFYLCDVCHDAVQMVIGGAK